MNYETAILIAMQRMRELGKAQGEYHYEPCVITASAEELNKGEIILKAWNEYYYLINYQNQSGIEISSDNAYFNSEDYTENTFPEFTGEIKINLLNKASEAKEISFRTLFAISEKSGVQVATIKPIEFLRVTIH